MRIPSRFRAETQYVKATDKKANVNPPMMAAVGNGDAATFRVAGRDNFYWIRLINDANRLTQCFSPLVALVYDDYIYVAKASDRKLTFYEFVSFIQGVGGETSPILNARGIIIPDNVAQGFYIEDDDSFVGGTPEYVRIVTTDGSQAVEFNFGNADVDFIVNASGIADALQILGSDGIIRSGAGILLVGGVIDVNGIADAIVLDADGDTTISAPTDDQIDFEISAADDFRMTANTFTALAGSKVTLAGGELEFTAATGSNLIEFPDNVANALYFTDATTAINFQQFVTTAANQATMFNIGEADVDFRIAANAGISDPTDAFFVEGSTGFVYMGDDAPGVAAHLTVMDTAVTTTVPYYGVYIHHVKTGGVTDDLDPFAGLWVEAEMNQGGGVIGTFRGIYGSATLTAGDVGTAIAPRDIYALHFVTNIAGGTVRRDVYGVRIEAIQGGGLVSDDYTGIHNLLTLNDGTVTDDTWGLHTRIDQAGAHTIGGDVFGHYIWMDMDGTVTGTAYMLYLYPRSNIDFCIYQVGAVVSHFDGSVSIGGTVAPLAQAHIHQSNAAGAIPVALLNQADVDYVLVTVLGESNAGDADYTLVDASDFGTSGALLGWMQWEIDDQRVGGLGNIDVWVPFYAIPT